MKSGAKTCKSLLDKEYPPPNHHISDLLKGRFLTRMICSSSIGWDMCSTFPWRVYEALEKTAAPHGSSGTKHLEPRSQTRLRPQTLRRAGFGNRFPVPPAVGVGRHELKVEEIHLVTCFGRLQRKSEAFCKQTWNSTNFFPTSSTSKDQQQGWAKIIEPCCFGFH